MVGLLTAALMSTASGGGTTSVTSGGVSGMVSSTSSTFSSVLTSASTICICTSFTSCFTELPAYTTRSVMTTTWMISDPVGPHIFCKTYFTCRVIRIAR